MNRRQFLQSTWGVCSAIWLGQNLLETGSVLAGEQPAKLLTTRGDAVDRTGSNQNYFRFELLILGTPEIIPQSVSKEFLFLLKNCQPGNRGGVMNYDNPYIRRIEVKAANSQDCSVRLLIKDPNVMPELRYALIPSVLWPGRSRLRIDAGSFSDPTAIKEKDLDIQETNLAFGPLATREMTDLIVLHHVGMGAATESAADIHRLHLRNGWSGIGYHYVIHQDGTIERGRPRETVGAHTYGYNQSSLGIVLDGNFEEIAPTDVQLDRAARLVAALSHIYQLSPDHRSVRGHRDLNATACPGKNLYSELSRVRHKALAYMAE